MDFTNRYLHGAYFINPFLFILLALWISNIIIWQGMMPIPGVFYYVICFMMSLFTSLSYLINRIFCTKIKGIISTFIFPSVVVVIDFIVVSTIPSGSFGSLAHTQSYLPILQLASVTGIWGIVFFIAWTASFVNWLWDNDFEIKRVQKGVFLYGITLLILIFFGQIRLNLISKNNDTVKIASVTLDKNLEREFHSISEIDEFDRIYDKIGQSFIESCDKAIQAGAKIIFGQETLLGIWHENEQDYFENIKKIASRDSVYIGLSIALITEEARNNKAPAKNKIIWISPDGKIVSEYYKAKPLYGKRIYGDGRLQYFDTTYGRICSAICFDMDFPNVINQIRKSNIDIMIVPANDWKEISPYHTFVAASRAIEYGFNMVRSTGHGLSASFNFKGEVLSRLDYFNSPENMMISDVPINGVNTIYSLCGNYFAFLCAIFLLVSCIWYFKMPSQ
ncbi:MAG: nitrilase-related carbon-nitrogen hydrolase [Ignavibacteriaceae bacterium]